DRAVSHDETTHAKYAWNLYSGRGFRHDPLMHGPLLFEVTAVFYALFGVSDFTARLYAALAGVALVATPWLLRRWLGRWGALAASVMLLISPAITYYSRYTRHDVPIVLFTTLLLWSILSYLDREVGGQRWLIWMGVFFALMYASKENAYIYTAVFLGLGALPLAWQVVRVPWQRPKLVPFALGLLVLILALGGVYVMASRQATVIPEGEGNTAIGGIDVPLWGKAALAFALIAGVGLAVAVVGGVGESRLRRFRLFDVLIVLGTFTLPLGSALLMDLIVGVDMTTFYQGLMAANFSTVPGPSLLGAFATLLIALGASVAIGLWWNRRRWPIIAMTYYGVFFVLYSTFFTYGWGVLSGLIGGLAYWLAQQGVQRGSQPWYYYVLVGPLYEYLPLLISVIGGTWLAVRSVLGFVKHDGNQRQASRAPAEPAPISELLPRLFPWFLIAWAALSWVAYIAAGEKMPWLFVHIAYPHILFAAWCLDRAIAGWARLGDGSSLPAVLERGGWILSVSLVCLALAWGAFRQSSGALQEILQQSGAGQQLALTISQLQPLGRTIGGFTGILLFSGLLFFAVGPLGVKRTVWLTAATGVLVLVGLTVRTMVHLAFVNDELAKEYLVYAHATPDVNKVLAEIKELSWYLTGTPDQIQVAYGKDVAWPFYWYMDSQYPNNYYFDTPDPERLLASPVILAADSEWSAVEAIVGSDYDSFDYKHIWWPVEDYKDLTWDKVRAVLTEPERRKAIWDIVWDRDYTAYARLRSPEAPFTLTTWPHRMQFRFYVRRDLADRVWNYGLDDGVAIMGESSSLPVDAGADPAGVTEAAVKPLARFPVVGAAPQGVSVAPDGSYYVADSGMHQVWHLSPSGEILHTWGSYGTAPGQFNEPWDVAVDALGDVYVADTWNHRVQKFTAEGEFL
ncbi:MAG: TIGR03663 family protein, partial [Anaerolineae bacterium]|nr:TIGR03663 family protein [Anaerolineae bacterium]